MKLPALLALAAGLGLSGAAFAQQAPVIDVCLSNACAEPAPAAPTPAVTAAPQRVTNLGADPVPLGVAFARYFDGSSPVLLKGPVVEVRLPDGMSSEIMVRNAEDGRLFRVIGGDPAALSPEMRASLEGLVGQDVTVRGYLAHDRACVRGCVVNGRDVTIANGRPVGAPRPPAGN